MPVRRTFVKILVGTLRIQGTMRGHGEADACWEHDRDGSLYCTVQHIKSVDSMTRSAQAERGKFYVIHDTTSSPGYSTLGIHIRNVNGDSISTETFSTAFK